MGQWEYKTIIFTRDNMSYFKRVGAGQAVEIDIPSGALLDDDDLNELGTEGWELISITKNNPNENFYREYYFKKEKI